MADTINLTGETSKVVNEQVDYLDELQKGDYEDGYY